MLVGVPRAVEERVMGVQAVEQRLVEVQAVEERVVGCQAVQERAVGVRIVGVRAKVGLLLDRFGKMYHAICAAHESWEGCLSVFISHSSV